MSEHTLGEQLAGPYAAGGGTATLHRGGVVVEAPGVRLTAWFDLPPVGRPGIVAGDPAVAPFAAVEVEATGDGWSVAGLPDLVGPALSGHLVLAPVGGDGSVVDVVVGSAASDPARRMPSASPCTHRSCPSGCCTTSRCATPPGAWCRSPRTPSTTGARGATSGWRTSRTPTSPGGSTPSAGCSPRRGVRRRRPRWSTGTTGSVASSGSPTSCTRRASSTSSSSPGTATTTSARTTTTTRPAGATPSSSDSSCSARRPAPTSPTWSRCGCRSSSPPATTTTAVTPTGSCSTCTCRSGPLGKDLERVTNFGSLGIRQQDAVALTNRLDPTWLAEHVGNPAIGDQSVRNLSSSAAAEMVEIDHEMAEYRQFLGEPGTYVVELGDHRLVMVDSGPDTGVIDSLGEGIAYKLGLFGEDEATFVGGSPNCTGPSADDVSRRAAHPRHGARPRARPRSAPTRRCSTCGRTSTRSSSARPSAATTPGRSRRSSCGTRRRWAR